MTTINWRFLAVLGRSFWSLIMVSSLAWSLKETTTSSFCFIKLKCRLHVLIYYDAPDRLAMESCDKMVVVSAIFGDHDKIRQPRSLGTKTQKEVCFFLFVDGATVGGLQSHKLFLNSDWIGVWRVVRVLGRLPYSNPAMNGVIPKHLLHRLFPNAKFSIWMDAKLQLTIDPLLLIHSLVLKPNADMAIAKHPFNIHTMQEAIATARWRKSVDVDALRAQMGTYCDNGLEPWTPDKLPYTTGYHLNHILIRSLIIISRLKTIYRLLLKKNLLFLCWSGWLS